MDNKKAFIILWVNINVGLLLIFFVDEMNYNRSTQMCIIWRIENEKIISMTTK